MKKEPQYIEYENGKRVLLDDDDAPEMSDEWFRKAKYGLDGIAEIMGEEFVAPLRLRGRPKVAMPKAHVNIRIDADILAVLRKTGKGWQTRLNSALRRAVEQGLV